VGQKDIRSSISLGGVLILPSTYLERYESALPDLKANHSKPKSFVDRHENMERMVGKTLNVNQPLVGGLIFSSSLRIVGTIQNAIVF